MLPPLALTIADIRQSVADARRQGKKVGFVPTMGALHAGHAALIRAARLENEFVVVSIFVNPTQFGPNEDLDRYPRTLEADRQLCAAVGTDVIFVPASEEMYPPLSVTWVEVEKLGEHLCGASRPGHFRGVTTVVMKLFHIVQPDAAYFGQKDAQQARIIEQMIRDLNVPIRMVIVPTVRESDGLAMSSRNRFLDPMQRKEATILYRSLNEIQEKVKQGERDVSALENRMKEKIASTPGARLDYALVVDAETLQPISKLERPALAAVAVFFGSTRLIDNIRLMPDSH